MTGKRAGILAGVAVIAAAGIGAGMAIAATSGGGPATTSPSVSSPYGPGYSYYHSMMGRYFGGNSMMGGSGYRWMMGAAGLDAESGRRRQLIERDGGAMARVAELDPPRHHTLLT